MPELDSYRYPIGESFVCSTLTVAMLRAGGVFEDMEINPKEFTPKDVFMLKIHKNNDIEPYLPKECLENDPGLKYCQISGKYLIPHGKSVFSTRLLVILHETSVLGLN